jgi:hypothetical protein
MMRVSVHPPHLSTGVRTNALIAVDTQISPSRSASTCLNSKAAAASGSSALSCKRILTDSVLLSYTIRTRKFGGFKLHVRGLETAGALLKSFHFFCCAGRKPTHVDVQYISCSVVPNGDHFNSLLVYCSSPGLKKIREWLFLRVRSYDQGGLSAEPMARGPRCQVIIYYN